jgi:outer membrane receptor for Fe3+-dicitrate
LGSEYGSFDQRRADTEVSGSHKDLSYYFYSSYADAKGYRQNSDVLNKDYNGRLGWTLTDILNVELMSSWHEDDYGLPGGLSDTELQTLGRRGSADDQDFGSTKDRNVHLRFDATPWPQDLDLGHLVVDLSYRNRDSYAEFAAYDFGTKRMIDTLGLNAKYTFNQELLGHDVDFVTGVDLYDVKNDIWGSGSNSDDITISKDEFGAYVFGEVELLADTFMNAGTRYQRADYTFDQRSGTANYEKQKADEQVSMLGVKYEYAPGSNIHAGVEQTFRFLATDEWYDTWSGLNTGLDQQTGIQYEVGIKHNFRNTTTVGITPYWIETEDEIFFDPKSGFFGSNSNYDTTRRLGVECEQRTDLLKIVEVDALNRWELFSSYVYQQPEFFDGSNDGKRIPMVPENQWTAGTSFGFWEHYDFSVSGRYTGSRFAINDTLNETAKVKSHIVMDTKLSYRRPDYQVYLAVDNVLGEQYYSYVSKAVGSFVKDYYPAPERTFRVGMSVLF